MPLLAIPTSLSGIMEIPISEVTTWLHFLSAVVVFISILLYFFMLCCTDFDTNSQDDSKHHSNSASMSTRKSDFSYSFLLFLSSQHILYQKIALTLKILVSFIPALWLTMLMMNLRKSMKALQIWFILVNLELLRQPRSFLQHRSASPAAPP